jgi:hypothetical protein
MQYKYDTGRCIHIYIVTYIFIHVHSNVNINNIIDEYMLA